MAITMDEVCGFDELDGLPPVKRLVGLEARKRLLEEALEQVKQRRAAVEQQVLDFFADQGVTAVNMPDSEMGRVNLHTRMDFYCSKRPDVTMQQVCETLEALGHGDMVSAQYNAARLKAWVKERAEADQVPDELKSLLKYDSIPRVIVVKG